MANRLCAYEGCGQSKNSSTHSRHARDGHEYMSDKPVGIQPMSAGMRAFRKESGYDEAVKAAKGSPCQIVSPRCTGIAEHLHEPLSRGRAGGLQRAYEESGGIPACDACNSWIAGDGQVWAAERGFLFRDTIEGREAAREAKVQRESAPNEDAPSPTALPKRSRLK